MTELSCAASMEKAFSVDSLGRTSQDIMQSLRNSRIIFLPQAAYRKVIDFLQLDATFCNHAIPTFHPMGWVSLTFNHQQRDKRCDLEKTPTETHTEARVNTIEDEDVDIYDWCSHGDFNGTLDYDWDEDYIYLSARERRRRRKQSKRSVPLNA